MKINRIGFIVSVLVIGALACGQLPFGIGDSAVQIETTAVVNVGPTDAAPVSPTEESATAGESERDLPELTPISGLCYHPYYPIIPNVTWTFLITSPESEPTIYRYWFDNITENSFTSYTELTTSEGEVFSSEMGWSCNEDGLFQSQFGNVSMGAGLDGFEVETISAEGTTMAAPELWVPGATWESSYSSQMVMSGLAIGMTITTVSTVYGPDPVSVPAGNFPNAIRLDQVSDIQMDIDLGLGGPSQTWYVENIGMVRNEATSFGQTTVVELISID